MLIILILTLITALLLRPLYRSVWRCYQSYVQAPRISNFPRVLLVLATALLLLAGLGWLFTAFVLLSAFLQSLSSGPAPFILLPWFLGITLASLPWYFADVLLDIVRKQDKLTSY